MSIFNNKLIQRKGCVHVSIYNTEICTFEEFNLEMY